MGIALLHGEQVLFGLILAAAVVLLLGYVAAFIWWWNTPKQAGKFAASYFLLAALSCLAYYLWGDTTMDVLSIAAFSFAFVLTLPWSLLSDELLLRGEAFKVYMLAGAAVNAALIYVLGRIKK